MGIKKSMIFEKFDNAKKYLKELDDLLLNSTEKFLEDFRLQLIGARIFEVLGQILLDICTHIVANSSLGTPKDYADCISKLGENKLEILEKKEVSKFRRLIKMRNLIVHQSCIP